MQIEGNWNLEVSTPFGKQPATLIFERAGGNLSGRITSQLGNAPLRDIEMKDDGFVAAVSLELQGRAYEADISGQVSGDQIEGNINVKFPFAPTVKFSGSRAS
ncbi:MAG: hypothetical protein WCD76_22345 [Pyrinomonadaceae bacterium]